ncbi:MAG: aminoglycoside phosphotransferase family protein [Caulobacterales bacterium]
MNDIMDRIRAAYEAELKNPRQVTDPKEVPPTYEAMTPEWLTKVLCKAAPGSQVQGFRFDVRDDGSSNRRRIFIDYNQAGKDAGLPASVFCKAAENLHNRIVLGVSGTAAAEANFYNLVRERLPIEAPKALYAGFDPENFAYLIMMRDMGDSAQFPTDKTLLTRANAEAMVETLAGLHSTFFQSPELGSATIPFKTWPVWWSEMMTGAPTFPACCDAAFGEAESVIPARLFRRRAEVWPCTDKSVQRHNELPHTLIHSDVHIKNWYIAPSGAMGLHDWQLATIGFWARDFVFSTTTALTVEQRRAWQLDLLRLYLEKMAQKGAPQMGFDEAFLNIRQQLMTALAFWTITLHPTADMPAMQPEDTTMELIKRMATAIDDYDSLDSFG